MPTPPARPTVLVVDDIEANLVAFSAELGRLDCELVCARSGNEALVQLLKREFAVMLLDVQMPDMDGYEVASLARQNPSTREVPIIFVTASHETETGLLRGYGSGAVDYLFKPVNPTMLRSKVQVFLDLFSSRQRLAERVAAHQRTMAELEAFNYSVSHDLRAPLRPLGGFSQILLEEYGDTLDDAGRDYLERIRTAALRMSQLIDDLLRLSKVSRAPIRKRAVKLTALAEEILAELRKAEPHRVVELRLSDLEEVQGDPDLLRIALENLLRNAWKFTRQEDRAVIELGERRAGDERQHFVRDNGAGFDMAYAAKMFRPFQRLHSTAEFEGSGIGLAIVESIIHHHGGKLWAESVEGEGATFYFALPA